LRGFTIAVLKLFKRIGFVSLVIRLWNLFAILLRDPDLPPSSAQNPHVLKYIPVFPRGLAAKRAARYRSQDRFGGQ
jgi:hypothetical protein